MKHYAIGLDIGTTSLCGILVDTANGNAVKTVNRKNDSFLSTEHPWAKEQDAARILRILQEILDDFAEYEEETAAIGLTGQMHGIVYVDRNGAAVSSLRTWQDERGNLPFRDGETYVSYLQRMTGARLASGYGAVTYFYDQVNHNIPDGAVGFCAIHDLAAMYLTGRKTPLTHASDAASFGLFNCAEKKFEDASIRKVGMSPDFFPRVGTDRECVGTYHGIPVSAAIGDNQAGFIGSVRDPDNTLLVNIGTGAQVSCLANTAREDPVIDCRPLSEDQFILSGSSLCGGRAYALLENLFREAAQRVFGQPCDSAFPAMAQALAELSPSLPALTVKTTFGGTRADPALRGSIENIGVDNWTMGAICAGFLRGISEELFDLFSRMQPNLKQNPAVLVGSGNGIRLNPALQKILEERFGLSVQIPSHREEAAYGAALYALVTAGFYPSLSAAQQLIHYQSSTGSHTNQG